jgi:glycine cleavage system H protein
MMYFVEKDLKFTEDHLWMRIRKREVILGLTEFAEINLGPILYVDLPMVGQKVEIGDHIVHLESSEGVVRAASPCSGSILRINEQLYEEPELINRSPYFEGWLLAIRPKGFSRLMDLEAYGRWINDPCLLIEPELKYTENHLWVCDVAKRPEVAVGLTDFAARYLGRIVYVESPLEGDRVRRGEPLFRVESIEEELTIPSPIDGEVVKVNYRVIDQPYLVNKEPYGSAWLAIIRTPRVPKLMGAKSYGQYVADAYNLQRFISRKQRARDTRTKETSSMPSHGPRRSTK